MLIIKTIAHETIWGGTKLAPYANIESDKIGHLYSLVSNGEYESEILNGEYKGQLFKKYFDENKKRLNLDNYKELPFVLALVDASDDLSLQVHPNDEIAKVLEKSDFGKNESWYFLEAPKTGKIFAGCKAKTSEELKEKVSKNLYNDIIDYLEVSNGDYVYIQAGTMHALAAGRFVFEIEENCNAKYRVYEFDSIDSKGNKRPLQTQNALMAINVDMKPKAQKYDEEKFERLYSTKLLKNLSKYENKSETIDCLTIINGEDTLEGYKVQKGTTIVIEPNESIDLNNLDCIVSRPIIKGEN